MIIFLVCGGVCVIVLVCFFFFLNCLLLTTFSAEVILLWMNHLLVQYLKRKLSVFGVPKLLLKLPCEVISMHLCDLFFLLHMVQVICTFACLQSLAAVSQVQSSSKDKQ